MPPPTRLERWWYAAVPGAARRLSLPDFLSLGAQKSGTTWLYANLRAHPDVFLTERKELHYFDNKFDRPLGYYAAFFEAGRGRVKGDMTPAYGILPPERIRFIRRIMPDVRLILLLRNPVDRAWSQVAMEIVVRKGRRVEEVPESEYLAFLQSERSIRRSDYLGILDAWLSVFPQEQICIGFFEDILEQPRKLLEKVFDHIGVRSDVDWTAFPVADVLVPHEGGVALQGAGEETPPCPENLRRWLVRRYAADLERLVRRFGAPAERWRDAAHGQGA